MSSKWTPERIDEQSGRVAIVTGASSGIGMETARVLAEKSMTVVIAVRNLEKGHLAASLIRADNPAARLDVRLLDLADLNSVRAFADLFRASYERLDLLINNAGVMIPPYGKTADGFELQMGTNHLGHFALTGLLIDMMISTPDPRIVTVSSLMHRRGRLDFSDLHWEKRAYSATSAYGDSKLANLYFTYELARKVQRTHPHLTVAAAHPGWTATELQRHSRIAEFMNNFFAQTPPMGALPTLRAALDISARNGAFYGPDGFNQLRGFPKRVESTPLSMNTAIAARLWEQSEVLTDVAFNALLSDARISASLVKERLVESM